MVLIIFSVLKNVIIISEKHTMLEINYIIMGKRWISLFAKRLDGTR